MAREVDEASSGSTASAHRPLKIIAGADPFGSTLKDALLHRLRSLNIEVEDIGTGNYYSVGSQVGQRVSVAANANPAVETRGLVACGTGVGVAIFANKHPGIYAATCLTKEDALNARSINNCNVLSVSGMSTPPQVACDILDVFLNTPFKSPCPASNSTPWSPDLQSFLDTSLEEMPRIGGQKQAEAAAAAAADFDVPCGLCSLLKTRDDKKEGEFVAVEGMPGAEMKVIRETPTSALVRFKAGSVEPAHHHTFGHDLVVLKGRKKVWNMTRKESYDLEVGDYLFTPAGDVHRVKYFEDTEFFIKWDGHWDLFLDEDLHAAHDAIAKENL